MWNFHIFVSFPLNNGMKANPDKYHFLHTANDDELIVKVDQLEIKSTEKENF